MKDIALLIIGTLLLMPAKAQSPMIDSSAISFKAKLLTTSLFGIADEATVLSEIENQNAVFLKSSAKGMVFIRVDFNQRYFKGDTSSHSVWLGKCRFYLSYNLQRHRYYRLGGFKELDLKDFFEDLSGADHQIFLESIDEGQLDFLCLNSFLMTKKRRRKEPCVPTCIEELRTSFGPRY